MLTMVDICLWRTSTGARPSRCGTVRKRVDLHARVVDFIEEYAGARWPPFSIPDDVQLRSPSVAPSPRAQLRAEIGRALRGGACGPELQPKFEPVVKPKGSDCRRPLISGASHRHLRED